MIDTKLNLQVGKRYVDADGSVYMVLELPDDDGDVYVYESPHKTADYEAASNLIAEYEEPRPPEYGWCNVYEDVDGDLFAGISHSSRQSAMGASAKGGTRVGASR